MIGGTSQDCAAIAIIEDLRQLFDAQQKLLMTVFCVDLTG